MSCCQLLVFLNHSCLTRHSPHFLSNLNIYKSKSSWKRDCLHDIMAPSIPNPLIPLRGLFTLRYENFKKFTSVFHAPVLLLIMTDSKNWHHFVFYNYCKNCQIVCSCLSCQHRICYKFMCQSNYWQWKLANERELEMTMEISQWMFINFYDTCATQDMLVTLAATSTNALMDTNINLCQFVKNILVNIIQMSHLVFQNNFMYLLNFLTTLIA